MGPVKGVCSETTDPLTNPVIEVVPVQVGVVIEIEPVTGNCPSASGEAD